MTPVDDTIETPRLRLPCLCREDAEAIVHGLRPLEDRWAADYPTDASLVAAGLVVTAAAERRELGAFGPRQIVRRSDGVAIGGCGFVSGGPGPDGSVHIAFSIVDEHARAGYAEEAVHALVTYARTLPGVRRVLAETAATNDAAVDVYETAGMRRAAAEDGLVLFEA